MINSLKRRYLRGIPSIDSLLQIVKSDGRFEGYPLPTLRKGTKELTQSFRNRIFKSKQENLKKASFDQEKFLQELYSLMERKKKRSLRRVVNATGIILNTNLGRAILAKEALEAINEVGGRYSDLEIDLESGERGSRYIHIERLLCDLTETEAALVVNNNAAAVLLVLNTLALGKEVIVSRGQLIEIGGSFRLPDVLKRSGATLVEVGTTNRTYISDYEEAITSNTALLLRSHTSNYRLIGFTAEVSGKELSQLGKKYSIPTVEDLGSGLLVDLSPYGFKGEPLVKDSVRDGLDVITFSGDKLLGGPQAGIILGKREYIERMKRNPLLRAIRVDKFTLAGLEATLKIYLEGGDITKKLPTLWMITRPIMGLKNEGKRLVENLEEKLKGKIKFSLEEGYSEVGGGSLPGEKIPTILLSLKPSKGGVDNLAKALRANEPPIISRISQDRVLLDLRTIREDELGEVRQALLKIGEV